MSQIPHVSGFFVRWVWRDDIKIRINSDFKWFAFWFSVNGYPIILQTCYDIGILNRKDADYDWLNLIDHRSTNRQPRHYS